MKAVSSAIAVLTALSIFNPAFSALAQSANLRATQAVQESSLRFVETTNMPKLPAEVATKVPFPMPVSGSCTAGTPYQINSVWDLYANKGELECVFAAGQPISAVPLGHSYGYLLAALNTAAFGIIPEVAYQGDFSVKTVCSGQYTTIGFMSIGGVKPGTAVWTNEDPSTYIPKLAPGEAPLPATSLVMDFKADLDTLCTPDGSVNPALLVNFNPFKNSIFPVKLFVDVGVAVGRDAKDGGLILLNKAYVIPEGEDASLGAMTVLMYAVKNFDPAVAPNFAKHTTITVPNSFDYSRGGLESFVKRMNLNKIVPDVPQALNPWLTAIGSKYPTDLGAPTSMAGANPMDLMGANPMDLLGANPMALMGDNPMNLLGANPMDLMNPSAAAGLFTPPAAIEQAAGVMGAAMMGPFQHMLGGNFKLPRLGGDFESMLPLGDMNLDLIPGLGSELSQFDFLHLPGFGETNFSGLDLLGDLSGSGLPSFMNHLGPQELGMNFMNTLLDSGVDVSRLSQVVNSREAPPSNYDELTSTFTAGGVSLEQVTDAMKKLSEQEYRNWRSNVLSHQSGEAEPATIGGSVVSQGLKAISSVFSS